MSEENAIVVNFGNPMPIFPLDGCMLLPQERIPLHIFEPRYRQMVEKALDGSGLIAMASFRGNHWKQEYHGNPPVMDAVCVGHIAQHERMADGRYNLILQGVCRARILRETQPEAGRLYRTAYLEPVGVNSEDDDSFAMELLRARLGESFEEGPLSRYIGAETMRELAHNQQFPMSTLVDLLSFALVFDRRVRYKLLAEQSLVKRAHIIENEVEHLARLIRLGTAQHPERWPKGCSWN